MVYCLSIERKYPSGSRGSPAKGVVRVNRSEGSNPSFRAKSSRQLLLLATFDFSYIEGFEGRQEKQSFSQVGGFYCRLGNPRLGLPTVRAAQGANPSFRAKSSRQLLLLATFDFSYIEGFEGRQEKQSFSQVGGFYRRLGNPRLGLPTVRAAQGANPSFRAKWDVS